MIYIFVHKTNEVELAGTVASQEMLDTGWQGYVGEIPERGSKFIMVDGVITIDISPESKIKKDKISKDYVNANYADIAYMNTTFQADEKSQSMIIAVLSAGSVPDGFFWMDKENNQVSMTFSDLQGLSGTILTRSQQNFIKLHSLKDQINSASTLEDLDAIIW